ncbi:hypothetical protein U2I54_20065 [Bacillus pseudomycoides]|uniref:Uncharacterized protein n=1 Tax=Bacillus bingmayongensis TaxID=1150157 RepID=A0ABU5K0Q3_9BACI|nr:hypothetical protein [Bacillus pseudomycoides]
MPVSLTYEIAKPSAESTEPKRRAKQAVLNGEVKTLKEYRELEKALRQANEDKQLLGQLLTEERNKPLVQLLRMVLGFELNLTGKICAVPFVQITERPENIRPREMRSLLSYNSKKGGDYYK